MTDEELAEIEQTLAAVVAGGPLNDLCVRSYDYVTRLLAEVKRLRAAIADMASWDEYPKPDDLLAMLEPKP